MPGLWTAAAPTRVFAPAALANNAWGNGLRGAAPEPFDLANHIGSLGGSSQAAFAMAALAIFLGTTLAPQASFHRVRNTAAAAGAFVGLSVTVLKDTPLQMLLAHPTFTPLTRDPIDMAYRVAGALLTAALFLRVKDADPTLTVANSSAVD